MTDNNLKDDIFFARFVLWAIVGFIAMMLTRDFWRIWNYFISLSIWLFIIFLPVIIRWRQDIFNLTKKFFGLLIGKDNKGG